VGALLVRRRGISAAVHGWAGAERAVERAEERRRGFAGGLAGSGAELRVSRALAHRAGGEVGEGGVGACALARFEEGGSLAVEGFERGEVVARAGRAGPGEQLGGGHAEGVGDVADGQVRAGPEVEDLVVARVLDVSGGCDHGQLIARGRAASAGIC